MQTRQFPLTRLILNLTKILPKLKPRTFARELEKKLWAHASWQTPVKNVYCPKEIANAERVCLFGGPACLPELIVGLCIGLNGCLPSYLYAFLFICLPSCLFVCLSACLSACLSVCLSICLSVGLSAGLSVYLPVCLSACLLVGLCICLSDFFPMRKNINWAVTFGQAFFLTC